MKHRGKSAGLVLAGVLVGLSIVPAANAVSEYLTATPSTQTFYVDDRQVELEAYAINGHNYVKLRDIGQVVGFNVYYDGTRNAAIMEPDKPYTGEDLAAVTPTPTPQPTENTDYAAQANSAIFTGKYTQGMYNAFRYAILNPDEVAAGTYQLRSMGSAQEVDTATAMRVTRALSATGTDYSVVNSIDGSAKYLSAKHNVEYDAAAAHVKPFLDSISHLPQREQVREMVWYIADRMTYGTKITARSSQVLAQDEVIEGAGNCMTYSSSLQFLCEQAGIPCILLDSENHQWNMVYVDGAWWHVDPTRGHENLQTMTFTEYVNGKWVTTEKSEAERIAILQQNRQDATVLYRSIDDTDHVDEHPETTQFLKELLVPGSTK